VNLCRILNRLSAVGRGKEREKKKGKCWPMPARIHSALTLDKGKKKRGGGGGKRADLIR